MDAQEHNVRVELLNALPQDFDFYHLGKVKKQTESQEVKNINLEGVDSVAFKLSGDINSFLIFLFPKDADLSLYSELGNIVVSQIANQLSKDKNLDVVISPPIPLNEAQLLAATNQNNSVICKTYTLFSGNDVIPIETLILASPPEGFGYA